MQHPSYLTELPPAQAGLAAALRRAFELPSEEAHLQLSELLNKLH